MYLTLNGEANDRTLAREEIETMCILHAASAGECSASELAMRLGLSADLGDALLEGVVGLVGAGWLTRQDDRIALSRDGYEWLDGRLAELRIARN